MTSRILLFSDHVEKDKGTDRKIERNKEQYKKTETGGSDSSLPCDFFFTTMYNTDVEEGLTFRFIAGGKPLNEFRLQKSN